MLNTEEVGWSQPQLLKISDLQMPKCFYPRNHINRRMVDRYAEQILSGALFPPIKVGKLYNHWIVVDGWHRTHAHIKLRVKYITGKVKEYSSEKELFADAVRFNNDHGYSLNKTDRRRSIKILKRLKFNTEEIMRLTSMSTRDVTRNFDKSKEDMMTVTGPGGKKIFMPFKRSATEDVRLRIIEAISLNDEEEVYETVVVNTAGGKYISIPIVSSTDAMRFSIEQALKVSRGNGLPELSMVLERVLSLISGTNGNNTILKYGTSEIAKPEAKPEVIQKEEEPAAVEVNPQLWEGPCGKCGLLKNDCRCK